MPRLRTRAARKAHEKALREAAQRRKETKRQALPNRGKGQGVGKAIPPPVAPTQEAEDKGEEVSKHPAPKKPPKPTKSRWVRCREWWGSLGRTRKAIAIFAAVVSFAGTPIGIWGLWLTYGGATEKGQERIEKKLETLVRAVAEAHKQELATAFPNGYEVIGIAPPPLYGIDKSSPYEIVEIPSERITMTSQNVKVIDITPKTVTLSAGFLRIATAEGGGAIYNDCKFIIPRTKGEIRWSPYRVDDLELRMRVVSDDGRVIVVAWGLVKVWDEKDDSKPS